MSTKQDQSLVKISANLPANELQTLRRLASEQGINMTDVLRRAIKLEELIHDERKDGTRVVLRGKQGDREIIPR